MSQQERASMLEALGLLRMNQAGGDGGGGDGGDAAAQQQQQQAIEGQQQQATDQQQQQQQQADLDTSAWPEAAREALAKVRDEAAKNRIKARDTETELNEAKKAVKALEAIQKALGGGEEGEQPTMEQLGKQVGDLTGERDAARIEAELLRTAWASGVDPAKLQYLEFTLSKTDAFKTLNTTTEGWRDTLKTLVTQAVAQDATLKATGARGTGDGQFGGAEQQAQTVTREQFMSMSLAQRTQLKQANPALYAELMGN